MTVEGNVLNKDKILQEIKGNCLPSCETTQHSLGRKDQKCNDYNCQMCCRVLIYHQLKYAMWQKTHPPPDTVTVTLTL